MTEKDKMLRQLMYDANYDQQLIAERQQAKELCYDYNHLRPSDEAGQRALMQRLLGSSKESFCILAPFWCDYGYNIVFTAPERLLLHSLPTLRVWNLFMNALS